MEVCLTGLCPEGVSGGEWFSNDNSEQVCCFASLDEVTVEGKNESDKYVVEERGWLGWLMRDDSELYVEEEWQRADGRWYRIYPKDSTRIITGTLAEMPTGPGGPVKLATGLKTTSEGLRMLFSSGSLRGQSIISIRTVLRSHGFRVGLTQSQQGYLFTNAQGEQVRIMTRGGGWDIRVRNAYGNYLDDLGNVAPPGQTHGIQIFSR